jgi:hypothetical protein
VNLQPPPAAATEREHNSRAGCGSRAEERPPVMCLHRGRRRIVSVIVLSLGWGDNYQRDGIDNAL